MFLSKALRAYFPPAIPTPKALARAQLEEAQRTQLAVQLEAEDHASQAECCRTQARVLADRIKRLESYLKEAE